MVFLSKKVTESYSFAIKVLISKLGSKYIVKLLVIQGNDNLHNHVL